MAKPFWLQSLKNGLHGWGNSRAASGRSNWRSARRFLRLEVLEDRSVPAATLVKDINLAPNQFEVGDLAAVGTNLFFAFDDKARTSQFGNPTLGVELWKSDGTTAGTVLFKDINPSGSSYPAFLTTVGSTFYFSAYTAASGRELWKSDGTAAGTVMVKDATAGTGSTEPANLTVVGSTLYFTNGFRGDELWKSDGTAAGTVLVKDIRPGTAFATLGELTAVGSTLYFGANDGVNGVELWKSDGTAAGTVLVKDIRPGNDGSNVGQLTAVGSTLYFGADDGAHGYELWKSDGTAAGTVMVKDLSGLSSSHPASLTAVGSTLYFSAVDDVSGRELWKTDGTAAGTLLVKDIRPAYSTAGPLALTAVGSTLYFTADDGVNGRELWKSDGTAAGTVMVKDSTPGAGSTGQFNLTAVGSTLYFVSHPQTGGQELWTSDGTAAGTVLVKDIRFSFAIQLAELTAVGSSLYFTATNSTNDYGRELWKSDGTAAGTVKLAGEFIRTADSNPSPGVAVGSTLYFTAGDGAAGRELWKSDGTAAGTVMVKDIRPGNDGSNVGQLTAVGSTLYFGADDGAHGYELWKSDGTAAGTVMVKDIRPSAGSSNPFTLTAAGSTLYFAANDGTNGEELWKSDGTAAGTVMVKDISPGASSANLLALTAVGSTLYFRAHDGAHGYELWKSDGTAAGTVLVKDIYPGAFTSFPENLTAIGSTLYFRADDGVNGVELWKSDGTAAGTVLVKDIGPGTSGGYPFSLAAVGSTLYFSAHDGVHGWEPWKSDGTAAGTVLVKDIRPGTASSEPYGLTAVGSTLYFVAGGLWRSDGTAAGTVLVKDIAAGVLSPNLQYLTAVGPDLYFIAGEPTSGAELWTSDGTTAGTHLVQDIRPGPASSFPDFLTAVGSTLYFAADDAPHGMELWKYSNAAPVVATQGRTAGHGQWLLASEQFAVSDPDVDPLLRYELWDDTPGAGARLYLSTAGGGYAAGGLLSLTWDQLQHAWIHAAASDGSDRFYVRASDGRAWSEWQEFDLATRQANAAPTVATTNRTVGRNEWLLASELFAVSDPDVDPLMRYELWDDTPGAGARLYVATSGGGYAAGNLVSLTWAELRHAWVHSAATDGSDRLIVRAYDGRAWSEWQDLRLTTRQANAAPSVATTNRTVGRNEWLLASELFAVSDPDVDPMTRYELWDDTPGAGARLYLSTAGGGYAPSNLVSLTWAELRHAWVHSAATDGSDRLIVRAYDGRAWSGWQDLRLTTRQANAVPTVATTDRTVGSGQWLLASELFAVSDADFDPQMRYELWDNTPGAGARLYLSANGGGYAATNLLSLTWADFPHAWIHAGAADGTERLYVRANDGRAWSDWQEFDLTTRAANAAPTVATTDRTVGRGEWLAAAELYAASDADFDPLMRYELWDDTPGAGARLYVATSGGGYAATNLVSLSWAEFRHAWVQGGAADGTDRLMVRASDGRAWSDWKPLTLTTRAANAAPAVAATNRTVGRGDWLLATELFAATDADADPLTRYELWDDTPGAGARLYLSASGGGYAAGNLMSLTWAELRHAWVHAAAVEGSDRLMVRASDGRAWSGWQALDLTTRAANAAPTVTVAGGTVAAGARRPAADFFTVTDPDGDGIAWYELWDEGLSGGARLWVDGRGYQPAGQPARVTWAELARAYFEGGTAGAAGQFRARASDGRGISDWKSFEVNTVTG